MRVEDCAMLLDKIIEKYRGIIVERLYKDDGYVLDRMISLSDGYRDVIMLIYVKKRE